MNNYTVEHYHNSIFNTNLNEKPTIYKITAESPREAAIIAHGFYNGYSIEEIVDKSVKPYRTIHEQLVNSIVPSIHTDEYAEHAVFLYDGISGHVIIVNKTK